MTFFKISINTSDKLLLNILSLKKLNIVSMSIIRRNYSSENFLYESSFKQVRYVKLKSFGRYFSYCKIKHGFIDEILILQAFY